ncbi:hypothetical protein CN324_28085 [Bacillus anthracis]|nr:hypothetical protein CN324_28085 [Bacillus anthracis]PFM07640.1 hypothetical protein COJ44_28085 [Bacillus anthracis]PFU94841.1 hypothetical protein COK92_08505 [Bacillus anthracis]PGX21649.1 hypothetical protein COE33_27505 [Bacillus anthracis]
MKKKLQVFISSTFTDLEEERQAAVQAVLNAGHIPAGMELFKAADTSQKETIKKWIEESDVYMLILGGRYGSIDEETGKSYTHWEYDYAGELKKPRFAIVIEEEALDKKVTDFGPRVIERDHHREYQSFKKEVLSKISKFYSDIKDIKIVILESLKEFERKDELFGWVSGKEIKNADKLQKDYTKLLGDYIKIQTKMKELEEGLSKSTEIDGLSYTEVKNCLKSQVIVPRDSNLRKFFEEKNIEMNAYDYFITFKRSCTTGINNRAACEDAEAFLYYDVAPILMQFNLVEKIKLAGVKYEQIQTSKTGLKFLRLDTIEKSKEMV